MGLPLAPIPPTMRAEVRHDGARWRLQAGPGRPVALIGLIVSTSMGVALGVAGVAKVPLALLFGLVLLFAAVAAARAPLEIDVSLTDRHLTLEVVRLFQRERRTIRVDEIESVRLAEPPELGGTGQLVVRADGEVLAFGRDQPREHTMWFGRAIDAARAVVQRRERLEGREYSFLRVPPESVEALREPPLEPGGSHGGEDLG